MRESDGFLSAETLGLTPGQRAAMIKFKEMGERGALKHEPIASGWGSPYTKGMKFTGIVNMAQWVGKTDCGTAFCIGGAVQAMSGELLATFEDGKEKLDDLCHPPGHTLWQLITPAQMTQAVTNFLTDGEANWELILDDGRLK